MDPQDFEQLVARYQGVVCAVAYAVVRDRARSEEIAQEAFLIAWQKLPAMNPPPGATSMLPAWVCGIARNLAANARRRRKEAVMDHVPEPAATGTPLDHLLDHERLDLANRALARLNESDREAVVLYYRGDGSIADVAATLGITEPAARQRLHRGRERLASALQSVETALRSTRPGPAFTAACVTAALAYPTGDASAATAPPATPKRWIPIAGGVIVAVAVLGVVAVVRLPSSSSPVSPPPSAIHAIASGNDRDSTRDAATRSRASGVVIKHLDAAARSALADKIRDARLASKRAPAGSSTPHAETGVDRVKVYDFSGDTLGPIKPGTPPKTKVLDKANIRWAIREIQPLLLECYTAQPRPKGGTLEVKMTVVGEPDLGTIVDAIEFGGSPHLTTDRDFAECMRETLFAIELPPLPSANETWQIHYPFAMP